MKLPKHILAVIISIFIVETQCGVIDNIFGKVKNTTNALRQDVRNVWSFSKSVVGIETPVDNRPAEEKRGLIGGVIHSTREKVHNIKNYFWNTDTNANPNDAGLFGNMYNRVKNNLSKVKGSILGDNQTPRPPSDNEKLIQKTLDKLFFGNGTRHVNGRAFQEAVERLKRKLQEIRDNVKKETPVHHGEGLIDVRLADVSIKDSIHDNTPSVNNGLYDAVEENMNKARDGSIITYNNMKNYADKAVTSLSNGGNSAAHQVDVIRDKAFDSAAKENELLQNSYSRISAEAQKVEKNVKNTVEDAKRLTY